MKLIDPTIPLGVGTPPWPTYEPLQLKYFNRLAAKEASGQVLTHSNDLGTYPDPELPNALAVSPNPLRRRSLEASGAGAITVTR